MQSDGIASAVYYNGTMCLYAIVIRENPHFERRDLPYDKQQDSVFFTGHA